MKNTMLAAALLTAATMTASAEYGSGYAYSEPNGNPLYASLAGGYMFAFDAPYGVLNLGYQFPDGCTSLSLQLMHSSNDGEESFGGFNVDWDESYKSLGLSLRSYTEVASKGGFYYAAGAGVVFTDVDASGGGQSFEGDSESLYIDATFGVQQQFSEHFSGHLGLRVLWLDDFTIRDGNLGFAGPRKDLYYGIEAGLTYHF